MYQRVRHQFLIMVDHPLLIGLIQTQNSNIMAFRQNLYRKSIVYFSGYKEAPFTIAKPESQKYQSSTTFKKPAFDRFVILHHHFLLLFRMTQHSGILIAVTALLLA